MGRKKEKTQEFTEPKKSLFEAVQRKCVLKGKNPVIMKQAMMVSFSGFSCLEYFGIVKVIEQNDMTSENKFTLYPLERHHYIPVGRPLRIFAYKKTGSVQPLLKHCRTASTYISSSIKHRSYRHVFKNVSETSFFQYLLL